MQQVSETSVHIKLHGVIYRRKNLKSRILPNSKFTTNHTLCLLHCYHTKAYSKSFRTQRQNRQQKVISLQLSMWHPAVWLF